MTKKHRTVLGRINRLDLNRAHADGYRHCDRLGYRGRGHCYDAVDKALEVIAKKEGLQLKQLQGVTTLRIKGLSGSGKKRRRS